MGWLINRTKTHMVFICVFGTIAFRSHAAIFQKKSIFKKIIIQIDKVELLL